MLVLFETAAGYALFKWTDKKAWKKADSAQDIVDMLSTPEGAAKMLKLQAFHKFKGTADALSAAAKLCSEDEMDKSLKKLLKDQTDEKTKLAVIDAKLGGMVKRTVGIKCVHDSKVLALMRGIREQLSVLLSGISEQDQNIMRLGLAHQLARYRLKFSPDKVDTMIVQAISLLDELDKELNSYAMRLREWYGWHFGEMSALVKDHVTYAQVVKKVQRKQNFAQSDLSDLLDEETENRLRFQAENSCGSEIADEDLVNIERLCDQVIKMSQYRANLSEYLSHRMRAIAPNLTYMVGELVGARLIAKAGSLVHLSKHPASTVQILGAEKALFRALKTKHDTPKYGLLFHASLVGQAPPKLKGKISRVLAAKTALAIRMDALGDEDAAAQSMGDDGGEDAGVWQAVIENREHVQLRLEEMVRGKAAGMSKRTRTTKSGSKAATSLATFSTQNDVVMEQKEAAAEASDSGSSSSDSSDSEAQKKKKKKKAKKAKKSKKKSKKKKKKDEEDVKVGSKRSRDSDDADEGKKAKKAKKDKSKKKKSKKSKKKD